MHHTATSQLSTGLVLAAVAVGGIVLGRHQLRMRRVLLAASPARTAQAVVRRVAGVFWLIVGALVGVAALAVIVAALA